jgi:hypothetical protein
MIQVLKIHKDRQTGILNLDDVKNWLKVDFDRDDALITDLIEAAIDLFELYTGYSVDSENVKVWLRSDISIFTLPYVFPDVINSVKINGNDVVFTFDGLNTIVLDDIDVPDGVIEVDYQTEAGLDYGMKVILYEIVAILYDNRGNANEQIDLSKIKMIDKYNKNLWF